MAAHGYSIANKSFESSISVPRADIYDDEVGNYDPLFEEMGRASTAQPDELAFFSAQGRCQHAVQ
ncbi:Mu-like prophage major head subunit gpT family protein [Stenotrophomonas indicatrix]|uniref:Mu-like prophage major head subunit gpT family protein n=1 Tax=Stenotrophomonas indicatrix TaxID=2045451 RepID=UPI003CCE8745